MLNPLEKTVNSSGDALCLSCKAAMVTRDEGGHISIRCNRLPANGLVRHKIIHCSSYYPYTEPWLSDYESLAWVWASDANGKPCFVRMRDLQMMGVSGPPIIGFSVPFK